MNIKNKNGITLIALIITIIVLLILAGVAINTLFGQNGLLNKAQSAKENTEIGRLKETVSLAITELYADNNGDINKINSTNIISTVKKNEKKEDTYQDIKWENKSGTNEFPGYVVFEPNSNSINKTVKVEIDLNKSVVGAFIPNDSSDVENTSSTYGGTIESGKFIPDTDKDNPITIDLIGSNPIYTTTPQGYIPIYTREQLEKVSSGEMVTIEQEDGKQYEFKNGANYILMDNIDLSSKEWKPIAFIGLFEGNNRNIKNMNMTISNTGDYGLFSTFTGQVKNLYIENIHIKDNASVSVEVRIGAIAGTITGALISKCSVSGNVETSNNIRGSVGGIIGAFKNSGGNISACIANVNVTAEDVYSGILVGSNTVGGLTVENSISCGKINTKSIAGGILGYNDGDSSQTSSAVRIQNCYNYAQIVSNSSDIGGILGGSFNMITSVISSTNVGNINGNGCTGGMMGYFNGSTLTIYQCKNKAKISTTGYNLGGMAGYAEGDSVSIVNNNNEGDISSNHGSNISGIVGGLRIISGGSIVSNNNSAKISATSSDGISCVGGIAGSLYIEGNSSANVSIVQNKNDANGEIILNTAYTKSGNTITNKIGGIIGDLHTAAISPSCGYHQNNTNNADINITGTGNTIVSYVGGNIGQVNKFSCITSGINTGNIKINTEGEETYNIGGILGCADSNSLSSVFNDTSSNGNIEVKCKTNASYIGGIVGRLDSYTPTIANHKSVGNIKIESNGSSNVDIGGVAGSTQVGKITNSYHIGTITVIGRCSNVAGVIGYQSGNGFVMSNCYHVGDINATNGSMVAGLMGYSSSSTADNSYVIANIKTNSDSSGISYMNTNMNNIFYFGEISGNERIYDLYNNDICPSLTITNSKKLTESESKSQSSYSGFDFTDTWTWDTENSRPNLK